LEGKKILERKVWREAGKILEEGRKILERSLGGPWGGEKIRRAGFLLLEKVGLRLRLAPLKNPLAPNRENGAADELEECAKEQHVV
jgi:hypothetical protein